MARDQAPITDEEIAALQEEMAEQRSAIRAALAEDLGGEPEDYDAAKYLADRTDETVVDGGE